MVIATLTSTSSSTKIHNSDSCNTLVSLNHGLSSKQQPFSTKKQLQQEQKLPSISIELRQTDLMLDDGSSLMLPRQSTTTNGSTSASALSCDEYIFDCVPILRQSAHQLLQAGDETNHQNNHHVFHRHSPDTLLYVHQGELAHAVPSQCDVLVSDRATTCHILVLRSTSSVVSSSSGNNNSSSYCTQPPLTTMAHLDNTTCYESCLRTAIQHHKQHHAGFTLAIDEDEDELFFDKPISMEIHVLGGFCDPEGTSQRITNWLLHFLADIAEEEAACLEFTLKTCAISTLNNTTTCNITGTSSDHSNAPIGRGLAIRLDTGHIGLAKVTPDVAGPSLPLRNARLWSLAYFSSEQQKHQHKATLQLIHTTSISTIQKNQANQSFLIFQPFWFQCMDGMDDLLDLPDDILLEYTSTSPSVEEKDFCQVVRNTLQFIKGTSCQAVFGKDLDRPLCFERQDHGDHGQTTSRSASKGNQWKLVVS